MPTRLAVGLEAKKSSSEIQMRPAFCFPQNFGSPVLFFMENTFGDLVCVSLYKKILKKARKILF